MNDNDEKCHQIGGAFLYQEEAAQKMIELYFTFKTIRIAVQIIVAICYVAPRVGAWIEIPTLTSYTRETKCRSLCGSED